MAKVARIRNKLPLCVYQDLMRMYKHLLREGNKDKLYFFKGVVYASLNQNNDGCYRQGEDFLEEMCEGRYDYLVFENYYIAYKTDKKIWFGRNVEECIKEILQ